MATIEPDQQLQQQQQPHRQIQLHSRQASFRQDETSQYNDKLYDRIRVLGQGSFGTATVHRRRADCALVVLKEINLSKFKGENERSQAINEALIMSTLNHVNIIKYFNSFTTETKLIIEMEYASLGTLISFLNLHGPLDEQEILIIFRQVTSGLNYLHSKNIIHLDLKMTNIFVSIEGFVKIGDFGIAQYLDNDHVTGLGSGNYSATTSNSPVGQLGTLAYSSPERCTGGQTDFKSDIWSLGCILYELITCEPLFNSESLPELVYCITNIQYRPIKRKISPPIRDLFEQMIARHPEHRPNAHELLCLVDQILSRIYVRISSQRRAQLNQKRHHNHRFELSTEFFSQNHHQTEMTQINYLHSLVYQVKLDSRHVQVNRVNLPQSKRIKEISKGKSHYLVLTYDNIVYGWGSKTYGQLGACGLTHGRHLARLASMAAPSAAGNMGIGSPIQSTPSSLASSTQTIIMSPSLSQQQQQQQRSPALPPLKSNNNLQLTRQLVISMLRESQPATKPFVINELNHRKITQVAAGNNFSVFLTKTGIVMTCGHGSSGCLGRGETLGACFMPCMVDSLLNMDVVCIASGPNHVVAVCGNGKVYAWGKATCGRLGVGRVQPSIPLNDPTGELTSCKKFLNYVLKPQLCIFPEGVLIKQVFCGDRCTIFVDSDRKCWACGENRFNKLGLDVKRRFKRTLVVDKCWLPTEIPSLNQYEIVTCNIGKNHTTFVTTDNKLIVFGQDIDHGYRLESDIIDARKSHRRISFELQTGRKLNAKMTSKQNYFNNNNNQSNRITNPPFRVCNHERLVKLALKSNQISGYKLKINDLMYGCDNDFELYSSGGFMGGSGNCDLKLGKDIQKQLDLYVKKSRAIKRMSFDGVISASCTPKFTLTLTDDNRVYFWGTRSYRMSTDNDAATGIGYNRKSTEPQLTAINLDDCFIKIGKTNNSLMASIQKLGSDQPIIHAQDPRLKANSLADLWILDYKPTEQHSNSPSSSISSLSGSLESSCDSTCCSSCCSSCCTECFIDNNAASNTNLKHDVILEPHPIISLYVPSMYNHPSCSVRLVDLFCFDENKFYLILDTTVKMQQQHASSQLHVFSPQYPHHQHQNQRNQTQGSHQQANSSLSSRQTATNGSNLVKKHSFCNAKTNQQIRSTRLSSLSSNIRLARESEQLVPGEPVATVAANYDVNNERYPEEEKVQAGDKDDLATVIEGKPSHCDDMSQLDSNNNNSNSISDQQVVKILEHSATDSDLSDRLAPTSQFGISSLDEPRSFSTFANGLDNQIIIGPTLRRNDLQEQHLHPLNFNSPPESSPLDLNNCDSPDDNQVQYFSSKRRQRTRLKTDQSELTNTTNGGTGYHDETSSMPSWVRNEFNQCEVAAVNGAQMFVFDSPDEDSSLDGLLNAHSLFRNEKDEPEDEDVLTCVSESRLQTQQQNLTSNSASLPSLVGEFDVNISTLNDMSSTNSNSSLSPCQIGGIGGSHSVGGSSSHLGETSDSDRDKENRINNDIDQRLVQSLSPGKRMLAHSLSQPDMSQAIINRDRSDEDLATRMELRRNSMAAENEDQQTNLLDCKVYQDSRRQQLHQNEISDASNLCLNSRAGSNSLLIQATGDDNLVGEDQNNLLVFSESSKQRIFWPRSHKYSVVKSNKQLKRNLEPQLGNHKNLSKSIQISISKATGDTKSSDHSYHPRLNKTQSTNSLGVLRKSLLRLFC